MLLADNYWLAFLLLHVYKAVFVLFFYESITFTRNLNIEETHTLSVVLVLFSQVTYLTFLHTVADLLYF